MSGDEIVYHPVTLKRGRVAHYEELRDVALVDWDDGSKTSCPASKLLRAYQPPEKT